MLLQPSSASRRGISASVACIGRAEDRVQKDVGDGLRC